MNNQQLIRSLGELPTHPIHLVVAGIDFNRWRTMTAQPPNIAGLAFTTIRQMLLDCLYEDWQDFRSQTIERHL